MSVCEECGYRYSVKYLEMLIMNLDRAQTCTSVCHRWFNERNMNLQIAGNESSSRSLRARWGYLPNIPGVWITGCCRAYLCLSLREGRLPSWERSVDPHRCGAGLWQPHSQIRGSQKCWQPSPCREIRLQYAQHPFPAVQLVILAFCLPVCRLQWWNRSSQPHPGSGAQRSPLCRDCLRQISPE